MYGSLIFTFPPLEAERHRLIISVEEIMIRTSPGLVVTGKLLLWGQLESTSKNQKAAL